jgi:hypothetical protein
MWKNSIATAALVASFAVSGAAQAITWGERDNNENPNVGTLLFVQNGVGFFSCTGTLIAPRVMLTAGHCVAGQDGDGVMQPNDVTYVRFDEEALSGIGNYPTLQAWFDAEWLAVEAVIPHPEWADYSQFPMTYDIGVVILSEPYTGAVPAALPAPGFLETLNGKEKNYFRAVGYGQQGTLRPFAMSVYERYKGDVRLLELNSYITAQGASSVKFSNNPGIGGGTCYGDSGGPTFFQDTDTVVAVTSFGWAKNGNCVGNDFNFRTDIPAALDFLADVLDQYAN